MNVIGLHSLTTPKELNTTNIIEYIQVHIISIATEVEKVLVEAAT